MQLAGPGSESAGTGCLRVKMSEYLVVRAVAYREEVPPGRNRISQSVPITEFVRISKVALNYMENQ